MIKTKEILVVSCDVCHEELMYDHMDGEDGPKLYPPISNDEDAAHYVEVNFYRAIDGVLHCDNCWRAAPHEHEWRPYMPSKAGSGNQCARCLVIEPGSQTPEFLAWQRQFTDDLLSALKFKVALWSPEP